MCLGAAVASDARAEWAEDDVAEPERADNVTALSGPGWAGSLAAWVATLAVIMAVAWAARAGETTSST